MTISLLYSRVRLTTVLTIVSLLLVCSSTVIGVLVRLVGSDLPAAGRVEVFYSGVWGTVCDDSWDDVDAKTVCRSIGWSDGKAYGSAKFGRGSGRIWLDDVRCSSVTHDLGQCTHSGWGSHNCNHGEDAGVWCVLDGSVILTGSPFTQHSGRVEVYHNGAFGTICDDHFDNNDADVICKMLGYISGGVAHGSAKFGAGQGNIWLDDLACSESATRLDQCGLRWSIHNCNHNEDAGVFCFQDTWTTTPCSVTCGEGTLTRSITCNGFGCTPRSETKPCVPTTCPVDGQWGTWNSWTSCSVSCGSGTRTRSRQCSNPAPAHNGRSCPGNDQDSESCTSGIMCPIDGQWGTWNSWTSCSVSCESGTRTRSRLCNNPAPAHSGRSCPGDEIDSEDCTSGIMCPIDGQWGQWNGWTSCSVSCENGTRTRSRQCNNPAPAHNGRPCPGDEHGSEGCTSGTMCPIDGEWGFWNSWTSCSVSCENGTRTRSRQCDNPAPAHNGRSCLGDQSVIEGCTSDIMCPIDGQWESWNDWSSCSVSCENGTRTRYRQCNDPAPAHNGRFCTGEEHNSEGCTSGIMCPIHGQWESWNDWSSCSVSCENGTRTRSRQCNDPAPAHNGRFCPGDDHDSEGCTSGIMCPIDGQWESWNDWSSCSVSCENGTRTRYRQCNDPAPAHNGRTCPGDEHDSEGCTSGIMCPIDGQWESWNDWSSCSVSCENGTRTRSRQCNNPAPAYNGRTCTGNEHDSEGCTSGIMCPIDGQWESWNDWSSCSVSCENGTRTRYRQCNDPAPAHNGRTCPGDEHDSEGCTSGIMCPIDGQWESWNDWSSCSVSCENGTRTRSRQCNNPAPAYNGRTCTGNEHDSEGCTSGIMCPIDGQWESWNDWSSCSVSCENGTRTRYRQCNDPAPAHNGRTCPGDEHDSEGCTSGIMCPIDGQWESWNDWSSCSVSCENGTRTRYRQCNDPAPAHNGRTCLGDEHNSEGCTSGIMCPIDGQWGTWNAWTSCSVSCEGGTRTRSRQCNNPAPAYEGRSCQGDVIDLEECTTGIKCPIDGEWAEWNSWSSCSVSCENGTRTRSRGCVNPAPAHGGRYCPGDHNDSEGCNPGIMCPVDGQWGLWHDWTACSVSCENGTRTRFRQCNNPAPAHNGRPCRGDELDSEGCYAGFMCPVDGQWSQWNGWTSCTVSCENGTRTRSRQCNNPAPAHNGRTCTGELYGSEPCTSGVLCPIDGQWGEWTQWSSCSVTCECGEKMRSRVCDSPYPEHGGIECPGNKTDTTWCGVDVLCPGACGKDRLMCTDKRTCISMAMSCDGVKQCPDGSDEINCIGRNLLYMPNFQYLFSSDSTKLCASFQWLVIAWLFNVVIQ
ncbi:A disintegrin and metalloproteinase with thrombospondin motifs adt-1-like isoform X9 [Pecten maximus]|uniref:A disintegrin and metalloproteinase with thrombospondin motifs adt-1-like isoform X9 n=1 Tax=Pecten maximus TaxID=6579 RepID=UPI0014583167|nr:A disintegrin and metalloproteinase with thrombospondin motifs adt-1-like isoform X9 [Pecten maximus]